MKVVINYFKKRNPISWDFIWKVYTYYEESFYGILHYLSHWWRKYEICWWILAWWTSGSFNWARSFEDYDYACEIANQIYHKSDEDGYYVYDVTVRSHDFIIENHLHY